MPVGPEEGTKPVGEEEVDEVGASRCLRQEPDQGLARECDIPHTVEFEPWKVEGVATTGGLVHGKARLRVLLHHRRHRTLKSSLDWGIPTWSFVGRDMVATETGAELRRSG